MNVFMKLFYIEPDTDLQKLKTIASNLEEYNTIIMKQALPVSISKFKFLTSFFLIVQRINIPEFQKTTIPVDQY